MPEFIYVVRATRPGMLTAGPTPDEADTLQRHFEYLQQLTRDGTVLVVGRTLENDERAFGLAIFRADDAEQAELLALADPAVADGVMRAEVFPFNVALLAADWPAQ